MISSQVSVGLAGQCQALGAARTCLEIQMKYYWVITAMLTDHPRFLLHISHRSTCIFSTVEEVDAHPDDLRLHLPENVSNIPALHPHCQHYHLSVIWMELSWFQGRSPGWAGCCTPWGSRPRRRSPTWPGFGTRRRPRRTLRRRPLCRICLIRVYY